MDIYLDSGPRHDFTVISAEGDSENTTLGFHAAEQPLLSSVNRKVHPASTAEGRMGSFLVLHFGDEAGVYTVSGFYLYKHLA